MKIQKTSDRRRTELLDEGLADLQRKEREGVELPLALTRFRAHIGTVDAVSAMQQRTMALLASYERGEGERATRISASRLSQMCGIEVQGIPRRRSSISPSYSSRQFEDRRNGHTGSLSLSSNDARIQLPPGVDYKTARVAVGHELGHYLIHSRGAVVDSLTARLPSSEEEEALAEYASRLLLLPSAYANVDLKNVNVTHECMKLAQAAEVTMHSAAARLGDPDSPFVGEIRAVILWRLGPSKHSEEPVSMRLTPQWGLCPSAYIPIKRCHAGRSSLVAELASTPGNQTGSRREAVSIGSLVGEYRVDAFAWGSVQNGTRIVLSAFIETTGNPEP